MVKHSYHECYENSITQPPNNTNLSSSSHFSVCICMRAGSPEVDTWCLHMCCARPFSECWGLNSVLHACLAAFYQWVHLPTLHFFFFHRLVFVFSGPLTLKKNNEILLAFLKSISKSDSLCLKTVIISPLHLWSPGTSATCYVSPPWKEVPG